MVEWSNLQVRACLVFDVMALTPLHLTVLVTHAYLSLLASRYAAELAINHLLEEEEVDVLALDTPSVSARRAFKDVFAFSARAPIIFLPPCPSSPIRSQVRAASSTRTQYMHGKTGERRATQH